MKAIDAAWSDVGKAQHNIPAHVAQEYCRPDRSFYPTPEFNEATLPRVLTFANWAINDYDSWFPRTSSNSGLIFNSGLLRSGYEYCGVVQCRYAALDLAAIIRLDEVRTAELTRSREHLNPPTVSHGLSL